MISIVRLRTMCYLCALLTLTTHTPLYAAGNAPDAPGNVHGEITGSELTLSWDTPDDDDGVVGYNIYVNDQYTYTTSDNTYTRTLDTSQLTRFYVVAFDSQPRRWSAPSNTLVLPITLTPDDLTVPPTVPTDLTGSVTSGQVELQWSASSDDEAVLGYNVFRDNRYVTTVSTPRYSGSAQDSEPHTWHVVAFDIRKNYSTRSDALQLSETVSADPGMSPSVPVGLQVAVTSGADVDTILLNWQPAADDQAVAGYNIYINGEYRATSVETQYEVLLPTGSRNTFQVTSFDVDKNFSPLSASLTYPFSTTPANPDEPPSVPSGLASSTNTTNGLTTVTLTWQASTGPVDVKGYNVYRNNSYLTTVRSNEFIDTLTDGGSTSYSLVAFDDFENYSARSQPLHIPDSINQAPFFTSLDDQDLIAGEVWELVLRPVDVEGDAAGILAGNPPSGMQLEDNGDGSRSLVWQPTLDDAGTYTIELTAFDLNDVSLRTTQTLRVHVLRERAPAQPPFSVQVPLLTYNLIEGDAQGVDVEVAIERDADFADPINLRIEPETDRDANRVTTTFSDATITRDQQTSDLNLALAIDTLPLLPEQRRFIITASSGDFSASVSVVLAVTPVARDDVYLLIGQSNMVGFSEPDAKRAGPGEPDEPDSRVLQANVTANDRNLIINQTLFVDTAFNFGTPPFARAEDPLHVPFDALSGLKSGSRIGMGLSFAKSATPSTTRNVMLVPAAWPGSAFCNTAVPAAHWNADPTNNPALGNTLLFDRALQRVNETLLETGGILRGILWHQGENDSSLACAASYEDNLKNLVEAFRTRILPDARGSEARTPSSDIPFVVGTMSKGRDETSDFSIFSDGKSSVDRVHRSIESLVPFSAFTNNDDLVPENGYPCGTSSCVHFGAAALREMGVRSYESLVRAASGPST